MIPSRWQLVLLFLVLGTRVLGQAGEYCSSEERRIGECPDQWPCTYCDPGDDYGDHYKVIVDEDEVEAPLPRLYMDKSEGEGQEMLTVEFTARSWTRCPNAGKSTWSGKRAPLKWHWTAEKLTDHTPFGAAMWMSFNGFEHLHYHRVIFVRRTEPTCDDPLPADEQVERQEVARVERIMVEEPYGINRLALPPNPYADIVRLRKEFPPNPAAMPEEPRRQLGAAGPAVDDEAFPAQIPTEPY